MDVKTVKLEPTCCLTVEKDSKEQVLLSFLESKESPKPKILVVEDSLLIQKIMHCLLTSVGYEPHIASTGKKALNLFSQNDYVSIFVDIDLPDMSGISVTKKIRQLEKKLRTPILAITSHTEAHVREECLKAGMNGYYNKPLSISQLNCIIDEHVPKASSR